MAIATPVYEYGRRLERVASRYVGKPLTPNLLAPEMVSGMRARRPNPKLYLALAVSFSAAGCGGAVASETDIHSPDAVAACLHKAGVSAAVAPTPPSQPGDWPLFDVNGTVTAHLGAATVTITVLSGGDNMAEYGSGTPPRTLVEAVWACAGQSVTTTPYTCDADGCTS